MRFKKETNSLNSFTGTLQVDSHILPGPVTSPVSDRHHPLTGTDFYCLVKRSMCVNNLPMVAASQRNNRGIKQHSTNRRSDFQ